MPRERRQAPAIGLPPERVHAWRLERQLLGRTRAGSPPEVARRLLGVQAQVVSSAALAIALRSAAPAGSEESPLAKEGSGDRAPVAATARALEDRSLVRAWAMRGTLHLFAAEDVPIVAAGYSGSDHWRRPAWLRWFGLTEPEMNQLIDAICDVLDDGRPRTRAELADEIATRLGERQGRLLLGSWGSALKIASDRRFLVQATDGATGAGVRFVRASRWIDGWRDVDPEEAREALVTRYLAAYGPATLRELLRWWGGLGGAATLKPVLDRLGPAVVEVEVGGSRAYLRADDVDEVMATPPVTGAVRFVGGFDPFIVGAGLRDQLLPPAHLKRVSRTAGWISPVVLVDGVAAAVWDARRRGDRLAITVEPFAAPPASLRRAIEAAAREVGRAHGVTAVVGYGSVFPEKASRTPFSDH